ncbi:MAG: hydroxylamine reductase, partial [Clostridiales bacterium]|nr:hydroxylamine reductase [Clostridiales bacterium]
MSMFCFQCEQTAGCKACTGKVGVCGKTEEVALGQDDLTRELIGLAVAYTGKTPSKKAVKLMLEGLFTTVTNVSFDKESIAQLTAEVKAEKLAAEPNVKLDCGTSDEPLKLWSVDEDIRSLKSLILIGLRGVAAYAYHAMVLGYTNDEVDAIFFKGLRP